MHHRRHPPLISPQHHVRRSPRPQSRRLRAHPISSIPVPRHPALHPDLIHSTRPTRLAFVLALTFSLPLASTLALGFSPAPSTAASRNTFPTSRSSRSNAHVKTVRRGCSTTSLAPVEQRLRLPPHRLPHPPLHPVAIHCLAQRPRNRQPYPHSEFLAAVLSRSLAFGLALPALAFGLALPALAFGFALPALAFVLLSPPSPFVLRSSPALSPPAPPQTTPSAPRNPSAPRDTPADSRRASSKTTPRPCSPFSAFSRVLAVALALALAFASLEPDRDTPFASVLPPLPLPLPRTEPDRDTPFASVPPPLPLLLLLPRIEPDRDTPFAFVSDSALAFAPGRWRL